MMQESAADTPTRHVETKGRTIAYRSIGHGVPLILCVRFRGVLDVWDPAFLDHLARSFRVITFDYSGLGQSTGTPNYDPKALAKDAVDLADALQIDKFAILGWSLGGMAAQVATIDYPDRISHVILIGTTPPGVIPESEPIFYERALKPTNDLDDETVLFFEPASEASVAASKISHDRIAQRKQDLSPPLPEKLFLELLTHNQSGETYFGRSDYRSKLESSKIPMLVISGDHEIVFPVKAWFDLVGKWKALRLFVLPEAGHGVQHQYPKLCGDLIASFVHGA